MSTARTLIWILVMWLLCMEFVMSASLLMTGSFVKSM